MQIAHDLNDLNAHLKVLRAGRGTISLVPTMGALHNGHMTLVSHAKAKTDHVVVSIFVNPRQFGPKEDFAAYPRPAEEDVRMLTQAGVDLLWMPSIQEMYPAGYATTISVAGLGDVLCGEARPGHFDGVSTVVAKLFVQVAPECALFGEKDWQQLAIIRRMTADLNLPVDVIGVPTVRDADGLALSSRNRYLTPEERAKAAMFPQALKACVTAIEAGEDVSGALKITKAAITAAGFGSIDYVSLVGADDLQAMAGLDRPARLIAAARLGKARLIDNFPVSPPAISNI